MYPPPITRSDFGTDSKASAPVDVTICFSSTGIASIEIEEDPVAIIKFFAEKFFSPSDDETLIVFLSTKLANP